MTNRKEWKSEDVPSAMVLAAWFIWDGSGDMAAVIAAALNAMPGQPPDAQLDALREELAQRPKRQYFYRVRGCPAVSSTEARCICWHDEGAGPFPKGDAGTVSLEWRDASTAALNAMPQSDAQDQLDALRTALQEATREMNSAVARAADAGERIAELRAERDALRAALLPFAEVLRGNYSHQSDALPIRCGFHPGDIRFELTLGDFRRAQASLPNKEKS